ncbi:MAG: HAD-IA family hydrolase, partial [Ginsengibacter sp.]
MSSSYKVLFSDIGGVILSNGWGHLSRQAAAKKFNLDLEELEALHNFIFNVYEMGKISFDEYLDTVIFNHPRSFSRDEMKEFIFSQSVLLPDMLPWLIELKNKHPYLKVISINNEARELNQYRINQFKLHDFFDAFVSSCEVGMRKPDPGIFRLALGIAQAEPQECLYFDDRPMLVEAAKK